MTATTKDHKLQQTPWVEQMEQAPNPMGVPMDNPSVSVESKDRKEILANLLVHFWHGYRKIRDTLTSLEHSIEGRDRQQAQSLLQQIRRFSGCSFRYEEDAVLPALRQRIGDEWTRELKETHDRVIRIVRRLEGLLSKPSDGEEHIEQARLMIQTLRVHLASTAGLTLLIEILPREQLIQILQARERALVEGKDLYEWEEKIRD